MLDSIYPYIIFKGKFSRSMGVIVNTLPDIVRPKKRVNTITIQGRHGVLHETDGTHDNILKTVECTIDRNANLSNITNWLVDFGKLILSSEPDKFYNAFVYDGIPFAEQIHNFKQFQVIFDCEPFKYKVREEPIELTEPEAIFIGGTYECQPLVNIYVNGETTVNLNINGSEFTVENVTGYVTIDCDIMDTYTEVNSVLVSMNRYTTGDYFTLQCGKNEISWTGNVNRIEIYPRCRWL